MAWHANCIGTLYVDLSKHTDLQVPQAKAFFNYLLEKANWYRPCILVMDNLDKLLTAEVEVSFLINVLLLG